MTRGEEATRRAGEQAADRGASSPRDLRFVAFRIGTETFLVDIMAVRQIVPYSGSTRVPAAPSFIEGVIVLRNEVIPVIDVTARLYPAGGKPLEQPLVLLTHTSAGIVGLKVGEVRRMVTLRSDELLPAPSMIRGIRGESLVAICQSGDEVFLVLDVDSVLTANEQRELQQAKLAP